MRMVQLGIGILLVCAFPALAQQRQEASTTATDADSVPVLSSATVAAPARILPAARNSGIPQERWLFPRHWIRGHVDFEVAPSHNEPDLGRCASSASQFGGANAPCTAFARYMMSGYLELQPIGRTPLRHVFLFYTPRFSFGHNVPQFSYTDAFTPMAYDRAIGVGIELPKDFEFRLEQHQVDWLGRYSNPLGAADLHTTGPYGLYSTVGVRWNFGGYGGSHDSF